MVELKVLESNDNVVRASYDCACGCTPSLAFDRGGSAVYDDCCCGNAFALGPAAARGLGQRPGFIPEQQLVVAPWNEQLQAAWLVGPSRHGSGAEHGHDEPAHGAAATSAIDPVCGMTVELEHARAAGLHATHEGSDYYFCGRGCLLDFGEHPQGLPRAGPSALNVTRWTGRP